MKTNFKLLILIALQLVYLSNISKAQICGTKTIGIGGDYTTLTAAFADLNSDTLCGALNLVLIDPVYPNETFPLVINYNHGSSDVNIITIKPAPGVSPIISCNTAWTVFLLNGTDHVIIDGSNQIGGDSKDITIINNFPVEIINSVISLRNNGSRGASNSTIKNCIIKGNPTVSFSYGISIYETSGEGFDNISIINNFIKNAKIGINFNGISGNLSENGRILSNTIGSEAEPIKKGGIFVTNCDNIQIDDNEISGEIIGNSNPYQYGISVGSNTTNSKIRKNKIHDFIHTGLSGVGCFGIYFNSESNSPAEISNNVIYNIKGDGDLVTTGIADWIPSGITIKSGGNINIFFNSINMNGNTLGTGWNSNYAGSSTCLLIDSNVINLDVRNNIFRNSMTTFSGTGANKTFGVVSYAANTTFADINFNNYFIDGLNPNIGYISGEKISLSDWQNATGKDINSLSIDPGFISQNDLHISQNSLNNKGTSIVGITTDFDDLIRSIPPDIGAFEYMLLPTVFTNTATDITDFTAILNGIVNANNDTASGFFEYGLTEAYGNTVTWEPGLLTGIVSTPVYSAISGLVPNTTYHFRVNATSNAGLSVGNDQTFTTLCPALTIISQPVNHFLAYGTSAMFSLEATNALTYQWQEDNGSGFTNITDGGIYSNSTTPELNISLPTVAMSGYKYRCIITGSCIPEAITDGNATLIVSPKPIVITANAGQFKLYGDTDPASFVYSYAPALEGSDSLTGELARAAGENAGNYSFTIGSLFASSNYSLNVSSSTIFEILQRNLTILAENKTKCYDGEVFSGFTVAYEGFVNGEDQGVLNGTLAFAGDALTAFNPGSYTIIPQGLSSVNYSVYYLNGTLDIVPSPTPTISGPNTLCAGTGDVIYITEPGFTNYVWTISYGGIITGGLNSNTVTVDWESAGTRSISVNYQNDAGCFSSIPETFNVLVKSIPVPIISGENTICSGVLSVVYETQVGYDDYIWEVSSGGIITSGNGTSSITVDWIGSGNQTVSADFTNELGCQAQSPTIFNVDVAPLPSNAGSISGPPSVCQGVSGVIFSVFPINNALTYEWSFPVGATITAGAETSSVTVDFAQDASSGIINVYGINDCGAGTLSPEFSFQVNPIPGTPVIIQHGDTLISSSVSGNQWYMDGIAISGATGQQHIVVYIGTYHVEVNLNECVSSPSNSILVLPVSTNEVSEVRSFDIYPNPNAGSFNFKLVSSRNEPFKVEIYNNLGALIWEQRDILVNGLFQSKVELLDTPAGIYSVVLRYKSDAITKKLIIVR